MHITQRIVDLTYVHICDSVTMSAIAVPRYNI